MTAEQATGRPPRARGVGARTRLAVVAGVLALLVAAMVGVVIDWLQGDTLFAERRDRAGALLESLATLTAMDMATGSIERVDDSLAELVRVGARSSIGLQDIVMLDTDGHVVTRASPATAAVNGGLPPPLTRDLLRELARSPRGRWSMDHGRNGQPVLVVSMPAVSGLRWGTVVATFDVTPVFAHLRRTRWVLLVMALVLAITLSTAVYGVLSRVIMRPLKHLADIVSRIQHGDLAARTRIEAPDELGLLARGINSMAEDLGAYTRGLEDRVTERTAEVQRKNEELNRVNGRLEEAFEELARLAKLDPLTEVFNRRYFFERIDTELARSERTGTPLAVLMFDVDHFKAVNDTHGHRAGDRVLCAVAEVLRERVRETDVVARYGGEEFVVFLVDADQGAGAKVADELRRAIAEARVPAQEESDGEGDEEGVVASGPPLAVTVSAGVAAYPGDAKKLGVLIHRADMALYAAKAGGRNRVVRWGPELGGAVGAGTSPK